jgi:protein SCO1/2
MTYSRIRWVVSILAAVGAASLLAMLVWRPGSLDLSGTSAGIGAEFVLASTRGGTVDSQKLAGKPFIVHFGYTHCSEVCPTMLHDAGSMLNQLGDAAAEFRVFFITVDPERDSVETVRAFLANFDPRIEGLVPTPAELQKLASGFRVFFTKVPSADGGYNMDHTASMFVFDAKGRLSETIAFGEPMAMAAEKIRNVLSGTR